MMYCETEVKSIINFHILKMLHKTNLILSSVSSLQLITTTLSIVGYTSA